jgi:hypothetical protein
MARAAHIVTKLKRLRNRLRITTDGDEANIEYSDPEISGSRPIGPQITTMTDRKFVDVCNRVMVTPGATSARLE